MKLERIQTVQRLPIQLEEAWDFFTSPKNLSLITPHWLDYRLNLDPPEYLHPGTVISASIRPIPVISTSWISEITHIRPPQFYITEQRFGPFKMWHHEHHFRAIDNGVEIEDIIMYGMHFGMIGSFVHNVYIRKRLHEIFSHRAKTLEQRFGTLRKQKKPERQHLQEIQEIFQSLPSSSVQHQGSVPNLHPESPQRSHSNIAQRPQTPRPQPAQHNLQRNNPQQANPQQIRSQHSRRPQDAAQPGTPEQAVTPDPQSRQTEQPPSQPVSKKPPTPQPSAPSRPVPDLSNPSQNKPAPTSKPAPKKPGSGKPGKPEPRKVSLDDIFHGTDD